MNYGLLQTRFKNSSITYHNLTLYYELYFNGHRNSTTIISYTIVLIIIKHVCHLNVKQII